MRARRHSRGFTLLELGVVLVIVSAVTGGAVAGLTLMLERQRVADTQARMDLLQQTLLSYSTALGYLPCPADITTVQTAAAFGTGTGSGAAVAGCTAANFNDGATTFVGMVPTKTLGLPDEAAIDGWGRRFVYAVDNRLTVRGALNTYVQTDLTTGSINIKDDSGQWRAQAASTSLPGALYVLLSFGQDGHGGWAAQGGAVRRAVKTTDANTLQNCHCNTDAVATGSPNAAYNTFVQQWTTNVGAAGNTNFDDVLRFARRTDLRPAASEMIK